MKHSGPTAFYNEIEPFAAEWLRNLITENLIAPGHVDERSIVDIRPSDLDGYTQCHFFAGIGVWSYSLRLAGWPDNWPIWTGSCPCQPFSQAGAGKETSDERHLWPHWFHLIEECQPSSVLGEQVASKDGLGWLDLVQSDLEGAGYACGAVDTCSAGVGAPHIRQRLRFAAQRLADSDGDGRGETRADISTQERYGAIGNSAASGLEYASGDGSQGRIRGRQGSERQTVNGSPRCDGTANRMADAEGSRRNSRPGLCGCQSTEHRGTFPTNNGGDNGPGPTNGFWADADWLGCRDGKWRPVEPGTFPLAHGAPSRVGRLRAYGNAIDAQATKVFIEAVMECMP